jgi:ABC-2 type transport system permease protein
MTMSPTGPPAADAQTGAGNGAHIVDRGFQRYEGVRAGVPQAIGSVAWQSMRATLGLGRPARHKIFPVIAIAIAYVPAIVFVGLSVLISDLLDPNEIADYASYYGFITAAILLFAGLVAPEVLVGDRRNGMLALYLSTPLHRGTYLVAKGIAVLATLAMVTLGPPLLLLIGYTFANVGPDGLGDWLVVLLRIFVSAFAVSGALTAISMAASSITDRRAFASIGVILLALATPAVASALVDGAELSANWRLIDVFSMPFELVFRIFGESGSFPELSTLNIMLVNAGWVIGGLAVVALRYSRMVVAR